ncbi:hypothetical protein ZWY2020_022345 [Hordeum vulgare]|nr:hypothetical protein ZWY2020_022345 [Hordeum vulgare]
MLSATGRSKAAGSGRGNEAAMGDPSSASSSTIASCGCDGSLLLDYTASFQGEKMATPKNGSEVRKELVNKIRHKKTLLQEIKKQFDDLQNIKLRNKTLQSSAENVNGICLPFVLVKSDEVSVWLRSILTPLAGEFSPESE